MKCRFCNAPLGYLFLSLGRSALSNSYLKKEQLNKDESTYPLDVYVCESCFLVQLPEFASPEAIFSDYAYFSSYSDTWLKHARDYVKQNVPKLMINENSFVVEIASNDGYLLQYFLEEGIPVLGIEPAANVAKHAREKGIPTLISFFNTNLARQLKKEKGGADLMIGNNVLAHVPGLNDFVQGLKIMLKPQGVITMEFPHFLKLMEGIQFDTIYHEHFSYFSLMVAEKIFEKHGLAIFDVEEIPTHGGSLRIYAKHTEDTTKTVSDRMVGLRQRELSMGCADINFYREFKNKVSTVKKDILKFLRDVRKENKIIVGYGAPAKGNTLLNYCGIGTEDLPYTVDRSPHKQGCYLPGSHIPIESPDRIKETKPDYVLILPWNIKDEIMEQISFVRQWGGKFVTFIPQININ